MQNKLKRTALLLGFIGVLVSLPLYADVELPMLSASVMKQSESTNPVEGFVPAYDC